MTVGKDVSGLFPDVLKNMQTEDLELKKLVYLYLINYAKSQPELVILAVNTFVKVRYRRVWGKLLDGMDRHLPRKFHRVKFCVRGPNCMHIFFGSIFNVFTLP